MAMQFVRKLPTPEEVKQKYPVPPAAAAKKAEHDAELRRIFTGESKKKVLLIGPCSADSEPPVLEYAARLARLQERVADKLLLVMRVYTNKPRTTGDGYKGMLYQPNPTEKPDIYSGLLTIRDLHTRVVADMGLPTADEMLYPGNYVYLSDLLSYVAVGARSVENQEHRLVASGMELPVGMKNPTGGDLSVMMNSITAAQHPHVFQYRNWEVSTGGNLLAHAILRGYVDKLGKSMPNYHHEDLAHLAELYAKSGLANAGVVIDANHANSGKRFVEQPRICKEVLHACRHNPDIAAMFRGFMIESYLVDGAQKIGEGVFGQSITDPCLGWEKSERLVLEIADLF